MAIREQARIRGVLNLTVIGEDGAVLERRRIDNLITKLGRRLLAELLTGGHSAVASTLQLAAGLGDNDPTIDDSSLESESMRVNAVSGDVEYEEEEQAIVVRIHATLPEGEAHALKEAGIYIRPNGDTPATLFNRATFPVINKGENMSVAVTWEITL